MAECALCLRSGVVLGCQRDGCPLKDTPERTTLTDGSQVYPEHRAKILEGRFQGQQQDYVVLSEADRAKGFVRPVRLAYVHEKCGTKTTMHVAIAETYARNPSFYDATFCCGCRSHFPVGPAGEFVWEDGSKVGS